MVAIIVILAAVLGVLYFQSANAKEPSKIKITSDKTLYEGDSLSIKLTDLNKTAIFNETVKIAIADKNGKNVVNESVKTNSKGNAKIDLELKKGKYNVTVTFGGNKNYTGNVTTQKLTIKEEVKTLADILQNQYMMDTRYLIKMGFVEFIVILVNSSLILHKTQIIVLLIKDVL